MIATSFARRAGLLLVMLLPQAAGVAAAQDSRPRLVDSAKVLLDDFKERQSIDLLRRALNPALGAPDSVWAGGVQLLAQVLLRTQQPDEAAAWLRWAVRLVPNIRVDSVNFVPAVVSAFHAARAFVASARSDSLTRIRWEWSTSTPAGGYGDLRIETAPGFRPDQVQLMVEGQDFLDPGRPRRLVPGSYRVAARATGFGSLELTTEVLPGVTTVVTPTFAPAADVLTAAAERSARAGIARVDASRLGQSSCSVGFVVGPGLLLTRYRAIRGAESVGIRFADGRRSSDDLRVAAYDVPADLALLAIGTAQIDSVPLMTSVAPPAALWAVQYPGCGDSAQVTKVAVVSADQDSLRFATPLAGTDPSSVFITNGGAAAGLATGSRSARTLGRLGPLLEAARRARAAGAPPTAREVAIRERHAFGQLTLRSLQGPGRVRVSPLESWQWPEAARVDSLPLAFRGPMGRYLVELLVGDQVQVKREVVIEPGGTTQLALGLKRRGGFPTAILGGIAAGVGGLAALLLGGGSPPPPPPTVGGITITLPN